MSAEKLMYYGPDDRSYPNNLIIYSNRYKYKHNDKQHTIDFEVLRSVIDFGELMFIVYDDKCEIFSKRSEKWSGTTSNCRECIAVIFGDRIYEYSIGIKGAMRYYVYDCRALSILVYRGAEFCNESDILTRLLVVIKKYNDYRNDFDGFNFGQELLKRYHEPKIKRSLELSDLMMVCSEN